MEPLSEEILKKEYDALRVEIKSLVDEINLLARYAIVITAAIFTWLFSNRNYQLNYLIAWLPFTITLLFCIRAYSLYLLIELISWYIETKIESYLFPDKEVSPGWETYLNNSIKKNKSSKSWAQLSTVIFWIIALVATAIFAVKYQQVKK